MADTLRNHILVSYDVCNAKRLRKVHKKMKGFGEPLQYSVFLCPLTPQERIVLLAALTKLIHHGEDRVMIINLGPVDGRGAECIEFLGQSKDLPESGPVVL